MGNTFPAGMVPCCGVVDDGEAALRNLYSFFDKNNDGQVTRSEMIHAIRGASKRGDTAVLKLMTAGLGLPDHVAQEDASHAMFEQVFQSMDKDDDRTITFPELQKYVVNFRQQEFRQHVPNLYGPVQATKPESESLGERETATGLNAPGTAPGALPLLPALEPAQPAETPDSFIMPDQPPSAPVESEL